MSCPAGQVKLELLIKGPSLDKSHFPDENIVDTLEPFCSLAGILGGASPDPHRQ